MRRPTVTGSAARVWVQAPTVTRSAARVWVHGPTITGSAARVWVHGLHESTTEGLHVETRRSRNRNSEEEKSYIGKELFWSLGTILSAKPSIILSRPDMSRTLLYFIRDSAIH